MRQIRLTWFRFNVYLFYQRQGLDVYTKELYVHVYEIIRRLCEYIEMSELQWMTKEKKAENERCEWIEF